MVVAGCQGNKCTAGSTNIWENGNHFEGDMILSSDAAKVHINNAAYRWPSGEVPYVIEGSFSE